ncbi:MAG: cell division protein SepF [Clostridiales bacterium]|jgi:cell division inhibitor SepF|nr:cell division protein SepF [Clostridiales bacterium]
MANVIKNVLNYFRGYDSDDENVKLKYNDGDVFDNKNEKMIELKTRKNNKIVSLNTRIQVVLTCPCDVDDSAKIIDDLKQNKICIVNLEGIERDQAQRISDFLGGASYALNGDVQRVSSDIFIIAPIDVNIVGNLREELKNNGLVLPWLSGNKS